MTALATWIDDGAHRGRTGEMLRSTGGGVVVWYACLVLVVVGAWRGNGDGGGSLDKSLDEAALKQSVTSTIRPLVEACDELMV